jgi:hypothetical protein
MAIGPVQYIIVAFPGNEFNGGIAPELVKLVSEGTVRILDLVFISKNADSEVTVIEFDQLDELGVFGDIDGEVGGLANMEDVEHAAALLDPGNSAALLIWEDLWAAPLAEAILESGGVLIEGARVPHAIMEVAMAELTAAS